MCIFEGLASVVLQTVSYNFIINMVLINLNQNYIHISSLNIFYLDDVDYIRNLIPAMKRTDFFSCESVYKICEEHTGIRVFQLEIQ